MIIFFLSEDATCNDKIVKAGVNGPFFMFLICFLHQRWGFLKQSIIVVRVLGAEFDFQTVVRA